MNARLVAHTEINGLLKMKRLRGNCLRITKIGTFCGMMDHNAVCAFADGLSICDSDEVRS